MESVVVYRSRFEQQADEFWFDLLTSNPNFTFIAFIIIALFVIGLFLFSLFKNRPYYKLNKRKYLASDFRDKKHFYP